MTDSDISDIEIIANILNGNKESYAVLISRYNQRLYRICKGYLKDESEIEDVMQEAYIKGFQNLTKFEQRSQFGTWIIRILINECLQRLKKLNMQTVLENSENRSIMNLTDHQSPETEAFNKELKIILERNIESLPEKYKLVFLMREVEQMSTEETSQLLEISNANVKIRLNRAKTMLRKSLVSVYPVKEAFEFNLVRCGRIACNVMMRI